MRWKRNVWLAATVLTAACLDAEMTGPGRIELAGRYVATESRGEFIFSENGKTWDLTAEGSTIELTLNMNGTTSGRIFVAAESAGADAYEADLAGSWFVRNDSVFVVQDVPTIISSMAFVVDGNRLRGELQDGSGFVRITLQK